MKYTKIDMHAKKSQALIIHCADPRFQPAYRQTIDELNHYYDLLVEPGASKAVVNNPTMVDDIKLLHGLHHFGTIYILDHVECGAFGPVDDELEAHRKMLDMAKKKLSTALPQVKVRGYLLNEAAARLVE